MKINRFEIIEGYSRTSNYLDAVCAASDSDRNALGFQPRGAITDIARRDGLFILIEITAAGECYAGHLLFARRYPRARVVQIHTPPEQRRKGAAKCLIDHLKTTLSREGFLSIYASVAEDLIEANAFWQSQNFRVCDSRPGGTTRNRKILVRCHELDSPQLFPTSGITDANPLGLRDRHEIPFFLVDLNVLFDVMPRRIRRAQAISLFQAERMGHCRLAVSVELHNELLRSAPGERTDPMAAYAATFPCIPIDEQDAFELIERLTRSVFPFRSEQDTLTPNERSDLLHLVAAIQNDLSGLITSDEALLNASLAIEREHGIQVISPAAFCVAEDAASDAISFATPLNAVLRLSAVTSADQNSVRAMLSEVGLSGAVIAANWMPLSGNQKIAECTAAWVGSSCVGMITWPAFTAHGTLSGKAAILESHPQAEPAARALLLHFLDRAAGTRPRCVALELPEQQTILRELAAFLGFRGSSADSLLMKSALGCVLTRSTWAAGRSALAAIGGPQLPAQPPNFVHPDQQIEVLTPDNNKVHVSLNELETLLYPALFCLPGRPAILTPIRASYADPLLRHSPQLSLLPDGTSSLYSDRHYLSDPRTRELQKRGTLILFYESKRGGGSGCVVALARVRRSYLQNAADMTTGDLAQSVLSSDSLADIGSSHLKTITVFDNVFACKRPVSLTLLQRLGCGRPNDVITTRRLSDEQLQSILQEAFGHG